MNKRLNHREFIYYIYSAVEDNMSTYSGDLTEFQKGHNAVVESFWNEKKTALAFIESLDDETQEKVLWLLKNYHADLNIVDENEICLLVNANDTFGYACADCEELKKEEIEDYYRLCKQYGYEGSLTWLCLKRGSWPIPELVTADFKSVYEAEKARRG